MKNEDFQKLVESVHQMGAIINGDDVPHRRVTRYTSNVRGLRERISLTQSDSV